MSQILRSSRGMHTGEFVRIKLISNDNVIVMISNNNHFTYDDLTEYKNFFPAVLKANCEPEFLGTFTEYIKKNNLNKGLMNLIAYLELYLTEKVDDSLFIIRVLDWLKTNSKSNNYTNVKIKEAIKSINLQESSVCKINNFISDINSKTQTSKNG